MAVRIETQAEPIPGYKLVERLGGGGFGEVWKAIAPGGIFKAIKFVYGDLQAASEEGMRAEQELKALSRVKTVRHPYVLSLERYDIIDGQLIIVMELADRNVWDRFRECRAQGLTGIPREELLRYMEEATEALDLMNVQYQLQHLDIKPQNLFLVHNHIKVADFGLVKDLEGRMASVTGGVTPVYAAPETFDGWISRFCDQYSLAIVYQELLTGQRPFAGTNVRQLVVQHLQGTPNLNPLPPADREAIGRALSKNPDQRHPSCQALMRALRGEGSAEPVVEVPKGIEETPRGAWQTPSTPSVKPPSLAEPGGGNGVEKGATREDTLVHHTSSAATAGSGRWIRVHEEAEAKQEETPPPAPAQVEVIFGDGVLFPSLVIGLGRLGLLVLKRLRQALYEQFGSLEALPNIRFLYLDTDPEAPRLATLGRQGEALSPNEVLLAKLNRPSYYLRSQQDGRVRIDSWFEMKTLYRIPRNLVTTGLRALGRLAFMDHYRPIARRLGNELQACAAGEGLDAAAQQAGLGMRTNRPRVYVITALAGGTGGGMFLDLAYVLRDQLKRLGYAQPDLAGMFFLPAIDRHPGRTLVLGNTFAALTELNHFSAPDTVFSTQFDEKDKAITDPQPPFSRCMMLPLPERAQDDALRGLTEFTADFLRRDLTTPLGRVADECRASLSSPGGASWNFLCQGFGMYRISWPRHDLLRNAARQLCGQIVDRWMTKEAAPVLAAVQALVAELWTRHKLGSENLLALLEKACQEALGQAPEAALAAVVERFSKSDWQSEASGEVLQQLEQIIGQPDAGVVACTGLLADPLRAAADKLTASWGEKLASFAVRLIEEPEFRLAGAEEAVRQIIAAIEKDLEHCEPMGKELTTQAATARGRIISLLEGLRSNPSGHRRAAAAINNLQELLRLYPTWRYQSLLLQRVAGVYVSLRGHLSDQLREINFCRARLGELRNNFGDGAGGEESGEGLAPSRNLYPAGCQTMNEAVQQLVQGVAPEELQNLDAKMQNLIQQQFTALVYVCLTSSNLLANLEAAMLKEAFLFAAERLAGANVAEMYLKQHGNEAQARQDLAAVFAQAAPGFAVKGVAAQSEISILAAPSGPAGERFRQLARQAVRDVDFVNATSQDDILFYRELPQLPVAQLEQLGPLAYEAYRQMISGEHFIAHNRTDIHEWRAAAPG